MSEDLTTKQSQSDSEKLSLILTTVQALKGRVDNVESEARPIWEKMVSDISHLQEGQSQLHEGQRALTSAVTEVRADILQLQEGQRALSTEVRSLRRDVDNRFTLLYDKLLEIDAFDHDIHERVTRLELNANPPNCQT
jgi:hypothetical protein